MLPGRSRQYTHKKAARTFHCNKRLKYAATQYLSI